MGLLDDFAAPFRAIGPDEAQAALLEHWGIDGRSLNRLETERDDSYRAETYGGAVILKIAHPGDSPDLIDLQNAALEHARAIDPGLPLQRIVPALDGERTAPVDGRTARVLTWLDGDLLDDVTRSPALVEHAGRMLGRLNRALADFAHPAADRVLAWDLKNLPSLRADADDDDLAVSIDAFTADVAPRLAELPQQIVHNDFHPGNVLVAADRPDRVSGILDFGDVVRTARVCDLALALAYLVPDTERPWAEVDAFTAGFEAERPLLPEERELLPHLIAARQIQRVVIGRTATPPSDRLEAFVAKTRRSIHRLRET